MIVIRAVDDQIAFGFAMIIHAYDIISYLSGVLLRHLKWP
jgi:hypothetical protein